MANFWLRVMASATALLLGGLVLAAPHSAVQGAGQAAVARPAAPPQWGLDIQLSPYLPAPRDIQKNISLALDPTNAQHVLASYDSEDQSFSNSGVAESTDAGLTWAGRRFYGTWVSDTIPYGNTRVDFNQQGTAYYSTSLIGSTASGYAVLTSTQVGRWSTPVPVVVTDYSEYRYQADLAVDHRAGGPFAGNVYMAWTYVSNAGQAIQMRASHDGAATWSTEVPVSDPTHTAGAAPSLAVANDGTVYLAYINAPPPRLNLDVAIYLNHSTDGGLTWGPDQIVGGGPITRVGALDVKEHTLVLVGNANSGSFLIDNLPVLAVAPNNPQVLYIVWNDGRWDSSFVYLGHVGQHGDIAFSRSTDGGLTWSAPVRVNDDPQGNGVDQFTPTLRIGPDGRIGVTWYDRRDDRHGYLYNTYYSESTDEGLTWSANQRVSDVSSDPMAILNPKSEGQAPGYTDLLYGPGYALPAWVDTRAGQAQDIYTDRGTFVLPSPTPTNTATNTATATATPSATPTMTPSATPSPTACTLTFADVPPDAYYAAAATWLACHAILSGYTCGGPGEPCPGLYFRPSANTTRGQLTKLTVLGLGWPLITPTTPTFQDVPPSQPFYPYIETAYAQGVINGYDCGGLGEPCPGRYFRPSAAVTRGQLSKIIVSAKGWGPYTPPGGATFVDVPAGSTFYGYVERAVERGIISGYDCGGPGEPCPGRYFRPSNAATRAQLSKILYLALIQP